MATRGRATSSTARARSPTRRSPRTCPRRPATGSSSSTSPARPPSRRCSRAGCRRPSRSSSCGCSARCVRASTRRRPARCARSPAPSRGPSPSSRASTRPSSAPPNGCSAEGPAARGPDLARQRLQVVGAVVAPAVDEERRRAGDAALVGLVDVFGDAWRELPPPQVLAEALDVQAEALGGGEKLARRERILVVEQLVVHLPELPLGAGGLRRLGGQLGVLVDVVERQV